MTSDWCPTDLRAVNRGHFITNKGWADLFWEYDTLCFEQDPVWIAPEDMVGKKLQTAMAQTYYGAGSILEDEPGLYLWKRLPVTEGVLAMAQIETKSSGRILTQ